MKIGIVGLGYWGPNLVRNFLGIDNVTEVHAVDKNESRLHQIAKRLPGAKYRNDYEEMLKSSGVDAVAIATPVASHFPLAKMALEYGKHVLIEKPLTASVREAEELCNLAAKKNLVLMVDHTFLFTGAVMKMKELIDSGEVGDLYYFDSVRINLGLFQHDVNVIWDLATHDISIMNHLIDRKPIAVSAYGTSHYNHVEDVAYVVVKFEDNLIAHFHVNWLAPVKIRRILLGGQRKMIVYDDMEPSEKIKVYDKGVEIKSKEGIYQTLIQYRTGDMYAPKLEGIEALSLLCNNFVKSVFKEATPASDGISGLNVVRILAAANRSLQNNGKDILLD
ncbi:MAG TPA: Gfo/Idh/MocA family oxidoreductase [Candidatus Acidoferrales bacterium]|nr:Gfo/Idh/MocA family oxidoreductase [Candidatus Acidoferrales bacterium]